MSKLLFMFPNKRIVEKSFFISSKNWEKNSGISGKKRDLHSVLSKIELSVWRQRLTEIPSEFFLVFSRVSNWTLAMRRKFSSKKTFHEKDNYFYRFRTLTELHLHVQRKVLFRKTVLDFFHQGMTLSQKFLNLLEFVWIFHSEPPSTSPQELLLLLKECFSLENPHICLSFSNFEQKRSNNWLSFFNRTVKMVF